VRIHEVLNGTWLNQIRHSAIPGHLPPSRSVWREVRDHTEREVESRHAYIGALEETVLRTLQEVRERQTKIKLRIKDDLKKAEAVSSAGRIPWRVVSDMSHCHRDTGKVQNIRSRSSKRPTFGNARNWKSKNVKIRLSHCRRNCLRNP
jgi:hypothetical protein